MDGDDKDKAAGNIGALGGSLGATGIKGLCDSFSGSSAGKLPGAGNLGTLLKKGVTTAQLSEVQAAYADDPEKLKEAFKTGFSGDAELFAGIFTTGLQGTPKKPDEDLRTQNLKKLTDAFPDQADLQKLVNGLASKKGGVARAGKEKAGARMNEVLTNHFKGDPAKLKDPFLDSLKKQPDVWSKEQTELEAAKKAHQDFEALSPEEKKKVKPKPVTWTPANENRLTFVKGVIAQYTPATLDTTIRNAASFKTASLKDEDLTMPATDLHGLGCSDERVEHFAKRHTRDHFPFKGAELASEDEPLNSDQRKPASLWPEETGVQEIKILLRDALNAITIPTYAQVATLDPATKPDFAQIDTEITVGTERLKVRIGFQRTPPNKVNVTQFYPKKQTKLDTICFEDMHGIKRALGK
jgi:hypothetical protein